MQWLKNWLVIFCVFLSLSGVAQTSEDNSLSNFKFSGSLKECLDSISNISEVRFNYKYSSIQKHRVDVPRNNYQLEDVLELISKQTQLRYDVIDEKSVSLFVPKGYFVYGTVVSKSSGERVVDALISASNHLETVSTDKDGIFRFYVTTPVTSIIVYHEHYQSVSKELKTYPDLHLIIKLDPILALEEVEVNENDDTRLSLKSFDEVKPSDEIIPTIGGENDALNNVKLLPGVQNVTFGDRGLSIRGGSPDQNNILLDGIPVYQTYHILGLFSIFHPQVISSIKMHKDAFPTKYGSRLSSVVDVSLNNGNKKKTEIEANIGILSSGFGINGPLIKDKLSYSFYVRRTYADVIALPFQSWSNQDNQKKSTTSLWSYDVFGKFHYQINEKNQISITGYNGGDQLNLNTQLDLEDENETVEESGGRLGWRNSLLGLKWKSTLSSRLFLSIESSSSQYSLKFNDIYRITNSESFKENTSKLSNGLTENRLAMDIDYAWNKTNFLKAGFGAVRYKFSPLERSYTTVRDEVSSETFIKAESQESIEHSFFAENRSYFKGGNVTYGFRYARFETGSKKYNRFQPKLLVIQNIDKNNQLKFNLSVANQFVHQVPNNSLGIPIDIWLPVYGEIRPMSVTQLSTRYMYKSKKLKSQIGVFSKFYNNIIENQNGSQLLTEADWRSGLKSGSGRAYGLELSSRYSLRKVSYYGSYTFSRSKRTIEGINNGDEYFSRFDRPHNIVALGEWNITKQDKILVTFNFVSGNPVTVPSARYIALINGEEVILDDFADINNFRMPSTHHLDVSYVRTRKHERYTSDLVLGVYNVYNRPNPFMLFVGLNEEAEPSLKIRSYLPIMPMIKYAIKI